MCVPCFIQNGNAVLLEGEVKGPIVCPLTLKEAGLPKWPFVMIIPCGCVVSESAYNEFYLGNSRLNHCPVCGNKEGFDRKSMVRLDMTDEQMEAARAQLEQSKPKKSSKRERKETSVDADEDAAAAAATSPSSKKSKKSDADDVVAKDLFVTKGASLEVYKSLFSTHEEEQKQDGKKKLPGTRSDLFLAQSGKGGVL